MNKTRRRKKSTPGEPFARVKERQQEAQKVTSASKIRHGKELIAKHLADATRLMSESDDIRLTGDYGAAAVKLREASNSLHLANAERRRLPEDAL